MKWLKIEIIIGLIALGLVLRLPSLWEPYWYGDEQIYLAIGQGIRKGLVLYRDITDYPNKPPLVYLLAALSENLWRFKFILMGWNLVHGIVMYLLLKRLFPKQPRLVVGGSLMFVGLTALPLLEGNIANGEMFMTMPVTLGMLLLWQARYFWAGLMLALGFLFKIPAAADIVAAGLIFWAFKHSLRRAMSFGLGLGLPIAVVLGILYVMGVSPLQLMRTAVGSVGYVSVWAITTGPLVYLGFSTLKSRLMLALGISLGLYGLRRKAPAVLLGGCLWLVWALFGATLSGRPYPHYFIQVVPPLVVTLVATIAVMENKAKWSLLGWGVIGLVIASYVRFGVRAYPVGQYYLNWGKYALGKISFSEYAAAFDRRLPRNYQIAAYIKARTKPEDKIYVWGTEPEIYVLTERLPVGKLVVSFHVEDLQAYGSTLATLEAEPPKYVVLLETEPREFAGLEAWVEKNYALVKQIEAAKIYRRTSSL